VLKCGSCGADIPDGEEQYQVVNGGHKVLLPCAACRAKWKKKLSDYPVKRYPLKKKE